MVFFFGSPLASCSSSTMSLSSSSSYWSRISELLAAGSVFLPLHIALACLLAGWCDDSAMLRVTDSAFRYAKFPMSNIRLLLRQCMPYLMLAALILNNYRLSETSGSSDHLHWRNHRQPHEQTANTNLHFEAQAHIAECPNNRQPNRVKPIAIWRICANLFLG